MEQPIAAIAAGSAVWACAPRDRYFQIDKTNRATRIQTIVNNTVFRLLENEPNLASKILRAWRERVLIDWPAAYGGDVIGFETFVYGEQRSGACYKADGWLHVGDTAGLVTFKTHPDGSMTKRASGGVKIILCRMADNRENEKLRRRSIAIPAALR